MRNWDPQAHGTTDRPITRDQHVRMLLVLGLLASAAVTLYTLRELLG